jgi:hypothetical protein
MTIPLTIQRSLVTACYITIMQYYPQRNKSAAARAYVKQSIKAVRYIIDELELEREYERESRL